MFAPCRHEGTGPPRAQQALRTALVSAVLSCAWLGAPTSAEGQQLPFTVTVVDWTPDALDRQRRAYYWAEAARHEVLFCVERWRFGDPGDGYQRIVIERTRREDSGGRYEISDIRLKCRSKSGEALPTIHTHPDGNCQMSPPDLATIALRGAQFDGIQCGDRYFVWAFAWQINAIVNSVSVSKQATGPPTSSP
jgi:hypothetical protein